MIKINNRSIIFIGLLILFFTILLSATVGYANITPLQTFKILVNSIIKIFPTENLPINSNINILYVRLPRILGAGLAGIGLTIAGIIYQGILNNPMSEPYILGVSSGAALGAATSIVSKSVFTFIPLLYKTPIFALTGALLTTTIVLIISGNVMNNSKILLFGVSINFFLSSLLTLIISLNHKQSSDIIFWTLGSFSTMNYFKIIILLITVIIGLIILINNARELNLFTMGYPIAKTLGLDVKKYRLILLTSASVVTGIIVSFTGIIGFVGLIIPHVSRLLVGSEHKKLISLSLPLGSIFMICCDTISRTVLTNELPVGVITSIVGAPIFIFLLKKRSSI